MQSRSIILSILSYRVAYKTATLNHTSARSVLVTLLLIHLHSTSQRFHNSATMDLPLYRYKPLKAIDDGLNSSQKDRGYFNIRAIALEPSEDPQVDLHGELRYVQLPFPDQDFTALSYVWGDPALSHNLICGSSRIRITANLDKALRRLRLKDKTILIWADAVCINQSDLEERGQQVQRMNCIYSEEGACSVAVWLGGGDDMDKCIDFLWGLSSAQYESRVTSDQADEAIQTELHRWFGSGDIRPIEKFLGLPWFTRRWVIQEAVLSGCHLYCGNSDIDWHAFIHAWRLLNLSTLQLQRSVLEHIRGINQLCEEISSPLPDTHGQRGILDLLVYFNNPVCTDNRDRIYSLLGLADDVGNQSFVERMMALTLEYPLNSRQEALSFEIDYESSIEDVYTAFAEKLLLYKDYLDVLQCSGAFRPELSKNHFAVQSWVPDWRCAMRHWPLLNVPWFTAGGRRPPKEQSKPFINYPWCSVGGVSVDSVSLVYPFTTAPYSGQTQSASVISKIEPLLQVFSPFDYYITGERTWQVLGLTFVADHSLNSTLRRRYAEGKGFYYDGKRMKNDARERDTQVFLDWWAFNPNTSLGRVNDVVLDESSDKNKVSAAEAASRHINHCLSAYLKPMATKDDWGQTSSKTRSGWHSEISFDDIPYFLEAIHALAAEKKGQENDDQGNDGEDKVRHAASTDQELSYEVIGASKNEQAISQFSRVAECSSDGESIAEVDQQQQQQQEGEEEEELDEQKEKGNLDDDYYDYKALDWRGDFDGFKCFTPDERTTEIYFDLATKTLSGRAFFLTEKGYLGIGPNDMQENDTVAVFHGGRTPFIIRPSSTKKEFHLVGDCYIHGLMRGEGLSIPGTKEQMFVIQ